MKGIKKGDCVRLKKQPIGKVELEWLLINDNDKSLCDILIFTNIYKIFKPISLE